MMGDLVEIGAAALEECRWGARKKNNAMLEKRGLWSDHTFQPSDAEYARALFTAIEKAGHRIVPVEATEKMLEAADEMAAAVIFKGASLDAPIVSDEDIRRAEWAGMLAAAPKVTP